jgi:hypothetical protein
MPTRFTDEVLTKLPAPPPGKRDYVLFDQGLPGLAVRVSAESKRLIFQGRHPDTGQQQRVTIGRFPRSRSAKRVSWPKRQPAS